MRTVLLLAMLAAACQRTPAADDSPGGRLEEAAVARGLVADPAKAGLIGSWASETDRLCIVSADGALRLGAVVDYGEGQACSAAGTVERRGDTLRVRLGDCRFETPFDGERIAFPADLPATCAAACTGRASLSALAVERLSESASEAATLRDASGRQLCGS